MVACGERTFLQFNNKSEDQVQLLFGIDECTNWNDQKPIWKVEKKEPNAKIQEPNKTRNKEPYAKLQEPNN